MPWVALDAMSYSSEGAERATIKRPSSSSWSRLKILTILSPLEDPADIIQLSSSLSTLTQYTRRGESSDEQRVKLCATNHRTASRLPILKLVDPCHLSTYGSPRANVPHDGA